MTNKTKQNLKQKRNKQENITFINACGSDYPNLLLGLNHFFPICIQT